MMALALSLVGQPVQPYLTTGATDFVNSVQKGKEDAIKTEELKTQSQKSALDLLTAQKKAVKEEEVSSTMPELMGRIAKGELTDKQKSDLLQVHPDFAKTYIATNDEKAKEKVNNLIASSLIKLTHSTDANNDAASIRAALKEYGVPLNLSDDATPEQVIDGLKVAAYGIKALDQKTKNVDEFGNVVEKNALGEQVGYDRAPVKATKPTPTDKTIDVPLGKDGSYVRYAINTDGSRTEIGKYNPPAQKSTGTGSKVYETLDANGHVQFELVKDNQLPTGKPKGDGVGKIEAGRIEMINNAANDAITALSQIQSLPIAAQVMPLFNSADAKKGVFTENTKKYLANKISEETAQIYRSIASGLALDAAKVKSGGMFVNQKVIDELNKGIVVQAGETEGTAMFKLAEAARRLYSSLATMTRGTPEQIEVRDALADYLKENFPDPNLILSAQTGIKYTPTPDVLHAIREKRKGDNKQASTPAQNTQTSQGKQPQTAREWYLYRFEQAKTPETRKKLTDEYIKMGSPK